MIGVLSVDDHPLLREESDMKLIAEASNGQEAIEKFRLHRLYTPRGIEPEPDFVAPLKKGPRPPIWL
jgi:hypothetical protein